MSLPVDEYVPKHWKGYTNRGTTVFTLKWELQHMIRNVQECGQFIESEAMACDRAAADTSFKLRLYCKGDHEEETKGFLCLHIVADPAKDIADLVYTLIIENRKKEDLTFMDQLVGVKDGYVRLTKLASWNTIFDREQGFVPEGVLTITLRVIIFDHMKPMDVFTYEYKQLDDLPLAPVEDETGDLAGNLGSKILLNEVFSDVTIKASGEDIPAHGCILSASWPYFDNNFWPPRDRSQGPIVLHLQVEAEIMKKILRYLYTGERPQMDNQSAMKMMRAAVENQFERLRNACKEYLMDHLHKDTVVDVLLMADKYKVLDLKRQCIQFLISREDTFWIRRLSNQPVLMHEIFIQSKEDTGCVDVKMELEYEGK